MHDPSLIISLTDRDIILDTHQLRQLARFCMRSHSSVDRMGASIIQRELRKGYPIFPVLDELVKTTATRILEYLGWNFLPRNAMFSIKFSTGEPPDLTRRVLAHVSKAAQGRPGENFYLDLLHTASNDDLESMIRVLFDLYASVDRGKAEVGVA